jgi:hypothetical protein
MGFLRNLGSVAENYFFIQVSENNKALLIQVLTVLTGTPIRLESCSQLSP